MPFDFEAVKLPELDIKAERSRETSVMCRCRSDGSMTVRVEYYHMDDWDRQKEWTKELRIQREDLPELGRFIREHYGE